jgi:DNA-binding NarL/FixJ family response regulator
VQRLTPRERTVLSEMAQGKSNGAIAAALSLSPSAIEKHVNKIFTELGLSDEPTLNRRVTAVLAYLREGDVADGNGNGDNDGG